MKTNITGLSFDTNKNPTVSSGRWTCTLTAGFKRDKNNDPVIVSSDETPLSGQMWEANS